jgi:hypothetical protein
MQKSNAVYTLILFYFKVKKTRNKCFFYFLKKNQNNLKKQVPTMQPLFTFPSKGSGSIFSLKKFSRKVI